jgi:hypothetical protein
MPKKIRGAKAQNNAFTLPYLNMAIIDYAIAANQASNRSAVVREALEFFVCRLDTYSAESFEKFCEDYAEKLPEADRAEFQYAYKQFTKRSRSLASQEGTLGDLDMVSLPPLRAVMR